MGYRIHIQKVHEIEYVEGGMSYENEAVNDILRNYCPNYWGNNQDDYSGDNEIEIPKDEFNAFVDKLTNGEITLQSLKDNEEINNAFLNRWDEEKFKEFVETMQRCKEFEAPNKSYVYLTWF